eukprot:c18539_g1_i1.p1 GENE.c18539_g1_i1~~c18539_g1_i1.p1  ORF type:complete len:559 (+),score=34.68 c18539_g1_i1:362-2038(+)
MARLNLNQTDVPIDVFGSLNCPPILDSDLVGAGTNDDDTSDCSTASDNSQQVLDLALELRNWARRFGFESARTSMSALLGILQQHGHGDLPKDWRTLLAWCEKEDKQTSAIHNDGDEAKATGCDFTVYVCGACNLFRFDEIILGPEKLLHCSCCQVSRARCKHCDALCVLTESLGKRCITSLPSCSVCLTSSGSPVVHRTFGFSVSRYVRQAFSDESACKAFLSPFDGLWIISDDSKFTVSEDWRCLWNARLDALNYSSEIWHGSRFRDQQVWDTCGMRSLIFVVSLDWFPPFQSRDYSLGVLTLTVANLPCTERAKLSNMWVLAVLEGPSEPHHTYWMLERTFSELRCAERDGILVWDALTQSELLVHGSCVFVAADTPACAKLGAHVGHSGYRACISCGYQGRLCGCKTVDGEKPPAIWDNASYQPNQPNSLHVLLSGVERKKRRGEHIAWTDFQLINDHQVVSDARHRTAQVLVARELYATPFVKAKYDRLRTKWKVNGISALWLLHPKSFSFTRGFTIDGMHTLLKGIISTMLGLTINDDFKKHDFNIRRKKQL